MSPHINQQHLKLLSQQGTTDGAFADQTLLITLRGTNIYKMAPEFSRVSIHNVYSHRHVKYELNSSAVTLTG